MLFYFLSTPVGLGLKKSDTLMNNEGINQKFDMTAFYGVQFAFPQDHLFLCTINSLIFCLS